jgi:ribonuclease E
MSQGLAQYESTVAGFGNAMDSIRSYTATYDTDFFRDWTEKHNLSMEKLKSAGDVSGGIGGAYIAGKLAYQAIQKKRGKGKKEDDDDDDDDEDEKNTDDHDGDEDGGNDAEDGTAGEAAETEGADAGGEAAADAGGEAAADVGGEAAAAAGELPTGAGGAVGDFLGKGALGTDEGGDTSALGASEEPLSAGSASQFTQEPVADPLGAEPPAAPAAPAAEAESGLGEEPDLLSARAQAEQGTGYEPPEEFNPAPQGGELTSPGGESTIAEGTESTLETGTATAGDAAATAGSTGADLAATAGSELVDTALTVAGAAAEAVPFLGIFAGIGIGLYELFHHPKAAPAAPPTSTANSRGEMVLPSYDSVVDTPASQSAF